ncbi:MAG: hypothetical protein AB2A00_28920 [Myxococcota bacterium]
MRARSFLVVVLLPLLGCQELTVTDVCDGLGIRVCKSDAGARPLACGLVRGEGDPGAAAPNANVPECVQATELVQSCEEQFVQSNGADTIWVIDNSASMTDEIEGIRANINAFAERVAASGLDFRVVFVTKRGHRVGQVNEICAPEPLASARCGDTEIFHHVDVEVGSNNPPDILLAKLPDFRDKLRDGARKSIIFVTDDNARLGANAFLNELWMDPMMTGVTIHGVIGMSKLDCRSIAAEGVEYELMASQTRGLLIPICCDSYDRLAQALGEEVAANNARFPLSRVPNEATVEVFFEDDEGRRVEVTEGWAYDPALRSVVFEEAARPEAGTRVIIRYFTS